MFAHGKPFKPSTFQMLKLIFVEASVSKVKITFKSEVNAVKILILFTDAAATNKLDCLSPSVASLMFA